MTPNASALLYSGMILAVIFILYWAFTYDKCPLQVGDSVRLRGKLGTVMTIEHWAGRTANCTVGVTWIDDSSTIELAWQVEKES